MFWAHSGPSEDRSDWQTLPHHASAVSRIAGAMGAAPIGLGRAAALAGLLHDLGKYDPAFDRVLRGEKVGVDHSTAGGAMLLSEAGPDDRLVAELIAYAILGHHAGLPDRRASEGSLTRRIERFVDRLDPSWRAEVQVDLSGIRDEVRARVRPEQAGFDLSLVVRMLFSCLVDADFRDTEEHFAQVEGRRVDRAWPRLRDALPDLIARFDAHMAGKAKGAPATELNALRRDILAHVRGKAAMAPGLFTLTVPTGGGKTLASLGFALDHARAHGHGRIIYAIPFTSIIDQTAAAFREVLGDGMVLEHHSAIDEEGGAREGRDKLRLAMEDWAAPVVVTTNVQLFESLFAARTSRARKLHNIAGSVIVLDEAQAIPRPLLLPCVRMLDALAANWGCTIVLCTATQPALGQGERGLKAAGLPLAGRELAPDPAGLASRLRRARVRWGGAMDDRALVAALADAPQGLVIVNSRGHALDLFRAAHAEGLDGLVHLTTRRCAADRQGVLAEVRRRLDPEVDEPCRVIATSLVEAGVDLDFPLVWRAQAGLDQVVQAAGRCNREGRRPVEDSVVTVFEAPDHPAPREVAALVKDAGRMLEAHRDDLLSLEAIEAYFGEVYWRIGERLDSKGIVKRLAYPGRDSTDFAFRSIAEDFRMIESGMAPVIVPLDEVARRAVEDLAVPGIPSGRLAQALQHYIVQVPPKARARLVANGRVAFLSPRLRGDQFAVLTDMSLYGADTGLLWEDADYLAIEALML